MESCQSQRSLRTLDKMIPKQRPNELHGPQPRRVPVWVKPPGRFCPLSVGLWGSAGNEDRSGYKHHVRRPGEGNAGTPAQQSEGSRRVSTIIQKITPMLWFDNQAEEAAELYVSIFRNSKMGPVSRYGEAGPGPAGSAMVVSFALEGQQFTALNGGPLFEFTEAVSFVVNCDTQDEVDHYWNHLTDGGDEKAQQCGWLKDRFGLSWQIVPKALAELMSDSDADKAQRTMRAMLQMKKLDIEGLRRAHDGLDVV